MNNLITQAGTGENIYTMTETIYETIRPYCLSGEKPVAALCRIIGEWQASKKEYEELGQEVQRLQGIIAKRAEQDIIIQKERQSMKENATPIDGGKADHVGEVYELREALGAALQLHKYFLKFADI